MADEGFAPSWVEFEKQLGQRPLLHGPTVKNCTDDWETIGAFLASKLSYPPPDSSVATEDRTVSGVKIRVYTPQGYVDQSRPLGIYMHGGGWAFGDLETDDANCRVQAKGVGVKIISVDYRLAPQYPYPAGLEDCLSVYKWALQNAESLGGAPGRLWIGGASAGGNLSFSLALRLIEDRLGDTLAGIAPQVPVTVHPDLVPAGMRDKFTSYEEHAWHTLNTKDATLAFWDAYGKPKDSIANPLIHERLAELKKVYIACAGHDTLRDDARLMRDKLEGLGVPVVYEEYEGLPHYFWTFPAECLKDDATRYNENLCKGIKWILS